MAIVSNFWLKGAKKRLAGAVIYQAGGQTIQRELASSVSNPRTQSQMTQRVKWANLVAFYRANSGWMKYAFETKSRNQSEYNKFMSLNVTASRIYLTRQAAASGACVVDNYIVTQGSLPSIEVTLQNNKYLTNLFMQIVVGEVRSMDVSAFSAQLIENNPAIQEGDQLSFIRFTQMMNETTGLPYVIVRKYEIRVSTSGEGKVSDYLPADLITSVSSGSGYVLAVNSSPNAGGFTFVLSRTSVGKTSVSSQSIIVHNNQATITAWSSQAALEAAIASYGESSEAFLTSTNAYKAQSAPLSVQPLVLEFNNNAYPPFSRLVFPAEYTGPMGMQFNMPVADEQLTGVTLKIYGATHTQTISDAIAEGPAVYTTGFTPDADLLGKAIWKIEAIVAGTTYTMNFQVRNEDSQGGLE